MVRTALARLREIEPVIGRRRRRAHEKTLMDYRDFYRRELLEDVMPFWMRSDLLDREYGGCITSVDRAGRSYNDDKSVWFQGGASGRFPPYAGSMGNRKRGGRARSSPGAFSKAIA